MWGLEFVDYKGSKMFILMGVRLKGYGMYDCLDVMFIWFFYCFR